MNGRIFMDGMRVRPFKFPEELEFPLKAGAVRAEKVNNTPPFAEVLKSGILKVNQLQYEADNMTNRLALGEVEDISQVSIAVEKAELALRLMVQIRDKLVDAHQQISRMGS
jgi:flagellar hook-basal body complex protein FliE